MVANVLLMIRPIYTLSNLPGLNSLHHDIVCATWMLILHVVWLFFLFNLSIKLLLLVPDINILIQMILLQEWLLNI